MMLQTATVIPKIEPDERIDRSSASSESIEDLMMEEMNQKEEEELNLNSNSNVVTKLSQKVSTMENDIIFIKHQLTSIMTHLHATPCKCKTCLKTGQNEKSPIQNEPTDMLAQLFPNASVQQIKTLLDLSKMNKLPSQVIHQKDIQPQKSVEHEKVDNLKLGQNYQSNGEFGGKIQAERHSEPVKKNRNFSFAPPVSTYYKKKENGSSIPSTPLGSIPNFTNPPPSTANTSTASPGPSSSEGSGDDHMEASTVPPTPTTPGTNLFAQSMVDMLKLNAQQNSAHSSGSPGFLRGRGRGRPKLIGDELDADLVDYMVSLKNADPHGGHFTASQALHMARQYILERAPGLLEEHGGHVKLKLTWAMKLVSRIAERQKEIELGLPAGSLSNMGRNLTNMPPGGNFMADMMAQNIFSQHMMMVGQQLGKTSPNGTSSNGSVPPVKSVKAENGHQNGHQNEENLKLDASQMAEIVNIKELNLPFLNNFLAELNDNNPGIIDGEIAAAALFAPNA